MFGFLKENLSLLRKYLRLLENLLKELSSIFIFPEREVKCTESTPRVFFFQGFRNAPQKASPEILKISMR